MKNLVKLIQKKIEDYKKYKFISLSLFATFFVFHFVFLILFCAQAQSIADNIKVETGSNANANPISIVSDRNFVNITFNFKISTKEFGEKSEIINLDSLKKDVKEDIELKILKNDNITIEKVECERINTNIKTIFFVIEIIVLILTIVSGIITLFLFNNN